MPPKARAAVDGRAEVFLFRRIARGTFAGKGACRRARAPKRVAGFLRVPLPVPGDKMPAMDFREFDG